MIPLGPSQPGCAALKSHSTKAITAGSDLAEYTSAFWNAKHDDTNMQTNFDNSEVNYDETSKPIKIFGHIICPI